MQSVTSVGFVGVILIAPTMAILFDEPAPAARITFLWNRMRSEISSDNLTSSFIGVPALSGLVVVSAIIPARNEAGNIAAIVAGLLSQRGECGEVLIAEVIVADNGSHDGTAEIARRAGARVISVPQPGYGQACWEACQLARGHVFLFVDGDGAANPDDARVVLAPVMRQGADLCIGVRHQPDAGSMSAAQTFGNALACALIRWIWRMPAADLGPYRAIRREAFDAIDMVDRSFGWTVEMQVRSHVLRQSVAQVPVRWHARVSGESKISGTLAGVIGAGVGILGMVFRLWRQERNRRAAAVRSASHQVANGRAVGRNTA